MLPFRDSPEFHAIPTVKLQTVTIRADSTDILDEVQNQLGDKISGPVMVVGLEASLCGSG